VAAVDLGHVDLKRRLVEKAAGNPRFAVEYLRQLREQGTASEGGQPGGPLYGCDDIAMPPSVHRLIAARLDILSPADKSILQDAAVLGDLVCVAGVAAASGRLLDEVDSRLRSLESREFLRRLPGRPVSPTYGQLYVFRHSSVRQVAYSQLLRAHRAERHLRVVSWLRQHATPSDKVLTDQLERAVTLSLVSGTRLDGMDLSDPADSRLPTLPSR
jgi:predicted ATPase